MSVENFGNYNINSGNVQPTEKNEATEAPMTLDELIELAALGVFSSELPDELYKQLAETKQLPENHSLEILTYLEPSPVNMEEDKNKSASKPLVRNSLQEESQFLPNQVPLKERPPIVFPSDQMKKNVEESPAKPEKSVAEKTVDIGTYEVNDEGTNKRESKIIYSNLSEVLPQFRAEEAPADTAKIATDQDANEPDPANPGYDLLPHVSSQDAEISKKRILARENDHQPISADTKPERTKSRVLIKQLKEAIGEGDKDKIEHLKKQLDERLEEKDEIKRGKAGIRKGLFKAKNLFQNTLSKIPISKSEGTVRKQLRTAILDAKVALLKAELSSLTSSLNDSLSDVNPDENLKREKVSGELLKLNSFLFALSRTNQTEVIATTKGLIDSCREKAVALFKDDPLHAGFALVYPDEAKAAIREKYPDEFRREAMEGENMLPIYRQRELGIDSKEGNDFLDDFFAAVDKTLSTTVENEGAKRCTPKQLRDAIKAADGEVKEFLVKLSKECEKLCISGTLDSMIAPKLEARINLDSVPDFKQTNIPGNPGLTAEWDEDAAKVKAGATFEKVQNNQLETPCGKVVITSLKKDIGDDKDTHSGDGARSYLMENGVSAHVVVDAAGNDHASFGATKAVIDMISQKIADRETPFDIGNSKDIQEFMKGIMEEGMKICAEREKECTLSFNLIFPGENGKRLLVGFSAGDTFVFTRKPSDDGSDYVSTPITTELEADSTTTDVKTRNVEYSGGALGYNIMSAPRLFDVYCQELGENEELYIASDAVRDNFDFSKNGLAKGGDVEQATLKPILDRMSLRSKMQELSISLKTQIESLEKDGQVIEGKKEDYAKLSSKYNRLENLRGNRYTFDNKKAIDKEIVRDLLGKEPTQEDFDELISIKKIKPDDYTLVSIMPPGYDESNQDF